MKKLGIIIIAFASILTACDQNAQTESPPILNSQNQVTQITSSSTTP
jgi:hypothetical protein